MTLKKMNKIDSVDEKFISREEVINVCNKLRNAQDKVLVYASYSGISGNKLEDLRNMKYSDYCPDSKVIKVSGKDVKVDWFFEELLDECRQEEVYYVNNGKVAPGLKNKFEINKLSKYILKGKPTIVNNNGLDPIGYPSLNDRMNVISELVGERLTSSKLYRSNVIEEMCLIKKDWRHKEVELYLKENCLKFKASNMLAIIKKVVETKSLRVVDEASSFREIKNIKSSKLSVYQKDIIQSLYKVVAGLTMVNEMQKRKIDTEHFKINENDLNKEVSVRYFKDELINFDRLYWEFVVNKNFNTRQEENLIKIYADREQYGLNNERYYVSYGNGIYHIFANVEYVGPGQREDCKCDLYSSEDYLSVINWIIDDFNSINSEGRMSILDMMPYTEKERRKFTPLYLNDIGLDMILALGSIEFKMLNRAFEICDKLESIKGIEKATPCVDVSTEGETFVLVIMSSGDTRHLKLEKFNKVKLCESIGGFGRYVQFESDCAMIRYFEKECKDEKGQCECSKFQLFELSELVVSEGDSGSVEKEKISEVVQKLDECNLKMNDSIYKDQFVRVKKKDFLNYKCVEASEIIFSMYDYDLSIKYDTSRQSYMLKRYIEVGGMDERIYDIFKTRDIEELIKWLCTAKVSNFEDVDYSTFLLA